MLYDSLLFQHGGGIFSDEERSPQNNQSATLVLGLGGVGIDALSALRGKIHHHLIPDNPHEMKPNYRGIQLLGIDTDEDYKRHLVDCRLADDEFFSLWDRALYERLRDKKSIKEDPRLNWMDIDNIHESIFLHNDFVVFRQLARYLLISKMDALEEVLVRKCTAALEAGGVACLEIHIITGLSGGTGGGCYLDLCYILQEICRRRGWNCIISGYFFLPDVVNCKPQLASNITAVRAYRCHAFAALKELNYHMDLRGAYDRFEQMYREDFRVQTQSPPVHLCYLISALDKNGAPLSDGYHRAIQTAADGIFSFLLPDDEEHLPLWGKLRCVLNGLEAMPRQYGANYCYHVLGTCAAEVPTALFRTYLATGLYLRFSEMFTQEAPVTKKTDICTFAQSLELSAQMVLNSLSPDIPALELPQMDWKVLAASFGPPMGYMNEEWADTGYHWLDHYRGKIEAVSHGLIQGLSSYDPTQADNNSLIGRLFRKLCELSTDPEFGPYYAASLLHNGYYDLIFFLDKEIHFLTEAYDSSGREQEVAKARFEERKDGFYADCSEANYESYKASVEEYFTLTAVNAKHQKAREILRRLKEQTEELYLRYFKPLVDMLHSLEDTFRENRTFLSHCEDEGAFSSAGVLQLVTLKDERAHLDEVIKRCPGEQLVRDFMTFLQCNSEVWLEGDPYRITGLIRRYMLSHSCMEMNIGFDKYLSDEYYRVVSCNGFSTIFRDEVIPFVYDNAFPRFPLRSAEDLDNSLGYGHIYVPLGNPGVYGEASGFCYRHSDLSVFEYKLSHQLRIYRRYGGLPLYAYSGIISMMKDYDDLREGTCGTGLHLYSYTRRGSDGSGMKDWARFLPVPIPYSLLKDLPPQ
ncbi:MAG: hypothetical protein IKM59_03575 [Oscillospiraceae bacterium]|nr:hypothetical protein [Oscillospiraceae bacterium]